jgi:hypothetical protein
MEFCYALVRQTSPFWCKLIELASGSTLYRGDNIFPPTRQKSLFFKASKKRVQCARKHLPGVKNIGTADVSGMSVKEQLHHDTK